MNQLDGEKADYDNVSQTKCTKHSVTELYKCNIRLVAVRRSMP